MGVECQAFLQAGVLDQLNLVMENLMKTTHLTVRTLLFILALGFSALAQTAVPTPSPTAAATSTATTTTSDNTTTTATKRPPVFRASKDQITQAQNLLKQKAFYTGEATSKLDDATREALGKYQTAEGLPATKTLNRATLEKMNIALTDKQKAQPDTSAKAAPTNSTTGSSSSGKTFRATKDQIQQAQKMLVEKKLFTGEATGKMSDDFRAAIKKYQAAESLPITGTLSRATVEKMGISLTEKQSATN